MVDDPARSRLRKGDCVTVVEEISDSVREERKQLEFVGMMLSESGEHLTEMMELHVISPKLSQMPPTNGGGIPEAGVRRRWKSTSGRHAGHSALEAPSA